MRTLALRFLVLFLNLVSSLAFGFCEITNVPGKISDRTRRIEFPDGREFMIVGHNHGYREFPLKIFDLLTGPYKDSVSFRSALQLLLKQNKGAIVNSEADLEFLRAYLKSHENESGFVAIEATNQTAQSNLTFFKTLRDQLRIETSSRDLSLAPLLSRATLLSLGAASYLKFLEPDLFQQKTFVGFESAVATERHDVAFNKLKEAYDRLKAVSIGDSEFSRDIWDTSKQLFELYGNYDPRIDDEILKAAEKKLPLKYQKEGMDWLRTSLEELKTKKERDKSVAEGMVSADKSGILVVGLFHLESIAQLLKKECMKLSRGAVGQRVQTRSSK